MLSACFSCLLPLGERTPLLGQELQARAGVVVPTEGWMGGGPFLGLGVTVPTRRPWLALRASGGVGFTEHLTALLPQGGLSETSVVGRRASDQRTWDLSLSVVLRRPDGGVRPFVSAGVGYYRLTPGTVHEPLLHGAGLNAGVGTELRWSGVNLGLELGIRVFGGHLEGTSGQRSYAPLTLSLGW